MRTSNKCISRKYSTEATQTADPGIAAVAEVKVASEVGGDGGGWADEDSCFQKKHEHTRCPGPCGRPLAVNASAVWWWQLLLFIQANGRVREGFFVFVFVFFWGGGLVVVRVLTELPGSSETDSPTNIVVLVLVALVGLPQRCIPP